MIAVEPLSVRVQQVQPLSPTLKHLVLEPADGGRLPTSLPGAHLSLTLRGGERIFHNAYSVVSHPEERSRYEIIVRRVEQSRGGSAFIHETLRSGDVISAAPPNSLFPLQNVARKHLLIAGGIGLTPFLSFLPLLRLRNERFELFQFAREGEIGVFERLLEPYASHQVHVEVRNRAVSLAEILGRQPLGTYVYTCGPLSLMASVQDAAAALGWPVGRILVESFGAAPGNPFLIRLASTGAEVSVGEYGTMLEALEDAGQPVSALCRGGVCGQCVTGVVDGTPEHRDHYLSDAEKLSGKLVMPCVSRAKSPVLTLDL